MLSWVSVNAITGSIIADLPGLKPDGSLKRTIGRHESQTATLPLDKAPANWRTATRKKSVFLVALSEPTASEPRGEPVWGGMVTERTTSHKEGVTLSMITAEDYLNDRYVGDISYNTGQNEIVEDLITRFVVPDGIPIRVVKLAGTNPVQKRDYLDKSDKTVHSVLEELSGILGGPEWTIDWEWVDERQLGLVLYVGARIGSPAPAGLGPASWFELPGNVSDAVLVEGYRRGDGANDVMAVSSGSGDARPQSPRQTADNDGRPKIELRWTPDTDITDTASLTAHAQRALAGLQSGTVALAIIADVGETTPFNLGDEVGFNLVSWAWPSGITGTARAIGLEWTDTTITPVLDVTGVEGIN